ncbi:MAG: response regulator [bacterium]|nr:response regulator [bacterium]
MIFAVDDEPDCLEGYTAAITFGLPGFTIETFTNPLELALRISQGRIPALVMTDGRMSPLYGWELAPLLRRIGYQGPLLLVSAETTIPSPSAFTRIIRKPFELDRLIRTIAALTAVDQHATY